MAEFDRANPLFERDNVPFEVLTHSGAQGSSDSTSKRRETFTVRILQGHRSPKNGSGDRERVIRFEMSDECNVIDLNTRNSNNVRAPTHDTPSRSSLLYSLPNMPNINAPIIMSDTGRGHTVMRTPGHQMRFPVSGCDLTPKAIPHLPIELYELEVGESDFAELRRDQALLVDFHDFANSLISLLNVCELGDVNVSHQSEQNMPFESNQCSQPPSDSINGQLRWRTENGTWNTPFHSRQAPNHQWQGMPHHGTRIPSPYDKGSVMPVSTYTCRLEVNVPVSDDISKWRNPPKSSATHARFSIVESNQFRELVHLSLNLSIGTDKSVRLYLSLRLNQIMMQNRNVHLLYAEEQHRSDTADRELIGLKKTLQELTQSTENEKYQIRDQAEERLQNENCSRLEEVNELKATHDAEIKALNERSEKNRTILESKVRHLEEINAKINSEKAAIDKENEVLVTKISFQETTNHTTANELSSLRSKLRFISEEKAAVEKSLHQLELQLTSLEYSNNTNEKTLFQTEAQRISAEKVSADAQRILSSQHAQMDVLKKRLQEAEHEILKYKDLTSRYQTNRLEMKKRMKDKVETIREQEDICASKEKELTGLQSRVQELADELKCTKSEKEALARQLHDAKSQIQDDKTMLENNQQVCSACIYYATYFIGIQFPLTFYLNHDRLLHG